MYFDLIVAIDSKNGMAKKEKLPWKNYPAGKEDMKWFKDKTSEMNSAVIMGRRTWESIPATYRPLKNRINIVLSSKQPCITTIGLLTDSPIVEINSFQGAIDWCAIHNVSQTMVIGGAEIYKCALRHPFLRYAYVTQFFNSFDCDLEFPIDILREKMIDSIIIQKTEHATYTRYTLCA
jgi:dihydrofolate reductase